MEKIKSGQAFLYRKDGLNSTVIDVRMKKKVRGDALTRALDTALLRYPYLKNKLVEKDGVFYFEECTLSMTVSKTDKFRVLGSMSTGYHLLDVTYTGKSIRVAFHHAMCDGRGIKPFIETLIHYYCCFKYHRAFSSAEIRLADESLLPGETQEPINCEPLDCNTANLPLVVKDGFALPECKERTKEFYRYELHIDQAGFIKYAKANNASPAILLALLVSGSINKRYSDADKPIVCSMAMDYRKEIGCPNTYKNCVGSIYLPFTNDFGRLPLPEQAVRYREKVKEQRSPDAINALVNSQITLFEKLDAFQSLSERQKMMSFFNDMCINTYVISYLGQMQFGDCTQYVEAVHLYNSGVNGLRINMISSGEYMVVDVLQNWESEDFIDGFLKELNSTGIRYTVSDRLSFATTKDKAHITAGRQSERLYKKDMPIAYGK